MQYIFEVFECDGAIDAEVRPCASGWGSIERDIDSYAPVQCCGINADYMTWDFPIACVDNGMLIKLNVSGLCFGDLDFSLEPGGIGDAREGRADQDLLSGLKRPFIPKAL